MFTTIAQLRSSHAQQNRVTTVENWLKRQNAAWTPETKFPIAFIAHSNSVDDVSWVNGVTSTHVSWPELAQAVLKEFGHKTQAEHRSAIEEMLDARSPGKTKVLAETIVPKYNAAFASLGKVADFGSALWPFTIVGESVNAVAETLAATAETPQAEAPQVEVNAQVPQPASVAPAPVAAKEETATQAFTNAVEGAMFVGLGKVMIEKNKTLIEAAKYSVSPTGGRLFSEYVQAFASGVEIKDVRACVKAFAARNG